MMTRLQLRDDEGDNYMKMRTTTTKASTTLWQGQKFHGDKNYHMMHEDNNIKDNYCTEKTKGKQQSDTPWQFTSEKDIFNIFLHLKKQ